MPAIAIVSGPQWGDDAGPDHAAVPGGAADALRKLLGGSPADGVRTGRILGVQRRTVLIELAGELLVLLCGPGSLTPMTLNIVADRPDCAPGDPVVLVDGRLRVGSLTVRVRRWWDSRVRPVRPSRERMRAFARLTADSPAALPPPLVAALSDRLRTAAADPDRARVSPVEPVGPYRAGADSGRSGFGLSGLGLSAPEGLSVARLLIGRGPGSTPSGDDLLCGAMAGLVAGGQPPLARWLLATVTDLLPTTTRLSAALLRHAGAGRATREALTVLAALHSPAPADRLAPAVRGLLALGHTSGADLAAGLRIGLTACLDATRSGTAFPGTAFPDDHEEPDR